MSAASKFFRWAKSYVHSCVHSCAPSCAPSCACCLCCALLLSLGGCGKKDAGLLVLDAQSREALSMPRLRPLVLPPRYNLDGGEGSLSRPAASLSDKSSVRLSELTPSAKGLETKGFEKEHKDSAFLKRLRLDERDPDIRRRIAEQTRQAVPLSQPLLDAIRHNSQKSGATQP